MASYRYNAFISFSAGDGAIALALEQALLRCGRRWYQPKAFRIFRDKTSLAAGPNLRLSIEQVLNDSEYFILIASPQAAHSHRVSSELETWLSNRQTEKLLIVLTDGDIHWSEKHKDFDWTRTTALPNVLKGALHQEPLTVDLRHAKRMAKPGKTIGSTEAAARIATILRNPAVDQAEPSQQLGPRPTGLTAPIAWIHRAWRSFTGDRQHQPEGKPGSEDVALGAAAPGSARPGDGFTAYFVAYPKTEEQEIDSQLEKLSPRSQRHLGLRSCTWRDGTTICVRAQGRDLFVEQPEQWFTWNGSRTVVNFDIHVDSHAAEGTTILRFDVLIGEIVISRLRLDLDISSKDSAPERRRVTAQPARTAFASYASLDRARVFDRVSEIQRNGVDVFLDCLSLNPGDKWKPTLEREIRDRDLFMLFWSVHARESQWVTWEWRTAIRYRGVDGIEPHPLDPVSEAEPPAELSALHFNDRYMLARKHYEKSALSSGA